MTGRLLSVGNVVVDVLAAVAELPGRGGDVWASDVRLGAGGGFNAMAAAARQGVPVAYGGAHGTGPLGDLARAALAGEGVEVLLPPRPGLDTGLVIGIVDGSGERTFVSGRGAESTLGAADLATIRPEPGDAVLVSGYGLTAELVAWVIGLPDDVTVALDPGPLAPSQLLARLLPRIDWLTMNAAEAAIPAGHLGPGGAGRDRGAGSRPGEDAGRSPGALARALAARTGVRRGVLVRVGAAGCLLAPRGSEPVTVPGVPVVAVDTTGAGDTHTGVFLARLLLGDEPLAAIRLANAAAAVSVTLRGPATAPRATEVVRKISANRPP